MQEELQAFVQKQAPLVSLEEVGHVLHEVKVVRVQVAQEKWQLIFIIITNYNS